MNPATNTFARLARTRQEQHLVRAQRTAREAARPFDRAWTKILAILATAKPLSTLDTTRRVRRALIAAINETALTVQQQLLKNLRDGHEEAASAWVKSLPAKVWAAKLRLKEHRLSEDKKLLKWDDELRAALGVTKGEKVSSSEFEKILRDVAFPPISQSQAQQIISGIGSGASPLGRPGWADQLQREGFSFDQITGQIASSLSQGKNLNEITKDVEPLVNGIRYRAARIARTESIRVTQDAERQTWKEMDDLIIGGQIHAVMDKNTREEHAERNGRKYWKEGHGDGAYSYEDMPQTPDAPNCRCYVTALIAGVDEAIQALAPDDSPFFSQPVTVEQ